MVVVKLMDPSARDVVTMVLDMDEEHVGTTSGINDVRRSQVRATRFDGRAGSFFYP